MARRDQKKEPLRTITVRLYARDLEYLQRRFPRPDRGWGRGRQRGGARHGEGGYNAWLRELVRWAIERDRWVRAASSEPEEGEGNEQE